MQLAQWAKNNGRPADLYDILSPLSLEGLLYTMARQRKEELRKAVSQYLTHLQDVQIAVSGRDIAALGLPPGPHYSAILRAVKRAVLNVEVATREEQLALARRLANSLAGEARDAAALS